MRARPAYFVESVDNVLRMLHLLLRVDRIRVSEAALELGVAPSTIHRLMAMLQYHGFAAQDRRTLEYLPGPDLIRFGLAASKEIDLRERARPVLERLGATVEETVHLGVVQGGNVLYIDSVESARLLRISARVGASLPLHCVSLGKALLATLSTAAFEDLYPRARLTTLTARTVATKAVLLKQLAIVRKRGFAHSFGESIDDVASIAAATERRDTGSAVAISIASPATRATRENIKTWLPHLHAAVAELGAMF